MTTKKSTTNNTKIKEAVVKKGGKAPAKNNAIVRKK